MTELASRPRIPLPWQWDFLDNGRAILFHSYDDEGQPGFGGSASVIYHKGPRNCFWVDAEDPNVAYLAHAANAYPRLVEAVREVLGSSFLHAVTEAKLLDLLRDIGEEVAT